MQYLVPDTVGLNQANLILSPSDLKCIGLTECSDREDLRHEDVRSKLSSYQFFYSLAHCVTLP